MARINVEDSIYKDARFIDLLIALGSREAAVGSLVLAWSVAQEYFLENGGKIPLIKWSQQKLKNEIIDCGLASIVDGEFVYLSGTEKQFTWLKDASKKGKKSGEARRVKSLKIKTNTVEHVFNPVQPNSTSSSSSSSFSSSFSSSISKEERESKNDIGNSKSELPLPRLAEIWNENCGGLPRVKKTNASRNKKAQAKLREEPNEQYWVDIVKRMARSEFINGKNDRSWRATFDFILQSDAHLKVFEGKYDNKTSLSVVDKSEAFKQEERASQERIYRMRNGLD